MENKTGIRAIEIKSMEYFDFLPIKYGKIAKIDGFTNNKNYLGTTENGIPVYINYNNELGVKEIMENKEYETLPVGKYQARVEQVIRKNNEGKETISLEMKVDGVDNLVYSTYCINGFGEQQMEIAKKQIDELVKAFGIAIIDELVGKEVVLTSKINDKGYTNYSVSQKREFFDWEHYVGFNYTDTIKFDCNVLKFYKKSDRKYVFVVSANVDGKEINEFVVYDFDRNYQQDNFNKVLKCLHITLDDCNNDLIDKHCKLVVKKSVGDTRVFINKKLGFDFKKTPKQTKYEKDVKTMGEWPDEIL